MSGFDDAPELPARTVGVTPPVRFRCPACEEHLRMRPGAAGRAIDCPACGAGLILSRSADGEVTAAAVGARRRGARVPVLPLAAGAVGVACAAAAGWVVLNADGPAQQTAPPPTDAGADAPDEKPIIEIAPEPAEEPAPTAPPDPVAGGVSPTAAPREPREPLVASVPVRRPALAPGPSDEVPARRLDRRLDATLSSYRMTRPAPLAAAVEDFEDLLRVRVSVRASRSAPVMVEFAGPISVRAVLEELARQAGVRVVVEDGGVSLAP